MGVMGGGVNLKETLLTISVSRGSCCQTIVRHVSVGHNVSQNTLSVSLTRHKPHNCIVLTQLNKAVFLFPADSHCSRSVKNVCSCVYVWVF